MRITRIEVIRVAIPFRVPFVVWRGEIPSKEHVIVRVETDGPHVGWGEAAPFLFYSPETAADVASFIEEVISPDVIGLDPRDVRAIYERFGMFDGHHFAKAAIEMAMWDLLGRATGQPLYRLIGGVVRDRVPVTTVLHVAGPNDMAEEARDLVRHGFTSLKMKIGFGLDRDEAMVAAVREAVGPATRIRVDAEEHYSTKEALAIGRRLERFDLELISQPVARTDWEGMAFLRTQLTMPLLADEGIHDPHDVLTCVKHQAADMVNIKVLKSGGLLPSVEMAAICRAAHLPVMFGSMIETGIGTLFALHLAATLPIVLSTELCGPLLYADDVLSSRLAIAEGEYLLPDGAGLGAVIDKSKLDSLRVA